MLAFQYDQEKIKLKDSLPEGLAKFIDADAAKTVIWISLNYELSLENVLRKPPVGDEKWEYAFQGLIQKDGRQLLNEVNHVIAKPHGSLNVWFTTVWESRVTFGKRDLHQLSFVNTTDRLKTCPFEEIGYKVGSDPPEERRPWVIGYLPDAMKYEITSPGFFADTAHDLCKWNVTYSALALQKASSLYILGYSMPDEDRWIWERLASLKNKDFPVYVASGNDSDRIIMALKSHGFTKTEKLTTDGLI